MPGRQDDPSGFDRIQTVVPDALFFTRAAQLAACNGYLAGLYSRLDYQAVVVGVLPNALNWGETRVRKGSWAW